MAANNNLPDIGTKEAIKTLAGKCNRALKEPLGKLIFGLIGTILGYVIVFVLTVHSMEGRLSTMDEQLNAMNGKLDNMNQNIENKPDVNTVGGIIDEKIEEMSQKMEEKFDTVNTKIDSLEKDVAYLEGLYGGTVILEAYDGTKEVISKYRMKEYSKEAPLMESAEIGKDRNGKRNSLDDVIGKKVLLFYRETGQEVYFWGRFNEKGQWDGDCLINVYQDNKLVIITNATYDNGILQEYQQVVPDRIGNENVWIISDRKSDGELNTGETWNYFRSEDYRQKFEFENVTEENMVDKDTIMEEISRTCTKLESYYCGNTSNGKFNDDTGTAYLIKYDENEKIRTLYQGRFEDGKLKDNTGNAWEIARNPAEDTGYTYYKGMFSENRSLEDPVEINLSAERINEIISDKNIKTEYLKWYTTSS